MYVRAKVYDNDLRVLVRSVRYVLSACNLTRCGRTTLCAEGGWLRSTGSSCQHSHINPTAKCQPNHHPSCTNEEHPYQRRTPIPTSMYSCLRSLTRAYVETRTHPGHPLCSDGTPAHEHRATFPRRGPAKLQDCLFRLTSCARSSATRYDALCRPRSYVGGSDPVGLLRSHR